MGRYRLEELLGLGGSAEVWRGTDERLRRPVAIKILHPHLLPDAAARSRFQGEARAAAALAHPGIVAVYDAEATVSRAAIVFELVEGEALSERLARQGPMPASEVARIGAELADALQHAHARGVVHRDVKPGNIIIDSSGRARLVDFGIARLLEDEAAHLTSAGSITGTLRYMAPERLAGEEATPAADLYALGAVLHEMLAGRPAFDAPTPVALAAAQQAPLAAVPGVPEPLAALVAEALDPDPARRPLDAATMAARLRGWAGESARPPAATPSVARAATGGAGGDVATVEMPGPPPEAAWPLRPTRGRDGDRWVAARRLLALAVGAVLVVAITAAAATLLPSLLAPDAGPALSPTGPTATASPSSTASPTPTASPTATAPPTPAPPATLAEAIAAFEELVGEGQDAGLVDEDAAEDLLEQADRVRRESDKPGRARQEIQELRDDVEGFQEEGEIASAALADQLLALTDRMVGLLPGG